MSDCFYGEGCKLGFVFGVFVGERELCFSFVWSFCVWRQSRLFLFGDDVGVFVGVKKWHFLGFVVLSLKGVVVVFLLCS